MTLANGRTCNGGHSVSLAVAIGMTLRTPAAGQCDIRRRRERLGLPQDRVGHPVALGGVLRADIAAHAVQCRLAGADESSPSAALEAAARPDQQPINEGTGPHATDDRLLVDPQLTRAGSLRRSSSAMTPPATSKPATSQPRCRYWPLAVTTGIRHPSASLGSSA